MPNKTFQTNDAVEEQGSDFNYREILDAVILHWHWFAISIIGCLFIAFLYLRYKAPVYSTGAEVLIKEDDPYKSRMSGNGLADFSQLGILTNSNEQQDVGPESRDQPEALCPLCVRRHGA